MLFLIAVLFYSFLFHSFFFLVYISFFFSSSIYVHTTHFVIMYIHHGFIYSLLICCSCIMDTKPLPLCLAHLQREENVSFQDENEMNGRKREFSLSTYSRMRIIFTFTFSIEDIEKKHCVLSLRGGWGVSREALKRISEGTLHANISSPHPLLHHRSSVQDPTWS